MALTFDRTSVRECDVAGIRARRVEIIALDASYPNGGAAANSGYPLTPGDVKLGVIEEVGDLVFWDGGANIRIGVYDFANQRLRIFIPSTGAEVANGVSLAGYTTRAEFIGK